MEDLRVIEDLRGKVLKMRSCRRSACGTFGSGRSLGSFCADFGRNISLTAGSRAQ